MSRLYRCLLALAVFGGVFAANRATLLAADAAEESEAEIKAALGKLPAADKTIAESQRRCAVEQGNRLGSMGTPVKVLLDGKPVFLCCAGCKKKATSDAKATAKAADTLKKVNASLAKLSPADRTLAEAQRFCAVESENRLGTMGTPVKLMIEGSPVFLCCKSCEDDAKAKPKHTVAKVAILKKANASN